ncbi:BING4CT and WD40 domain containing protein [Trichuris trichiura]|uniref:BING4CT and WD40 domain containing protein n=1 Tax=Trichuris trichiura TaxID=36087 RepID=A0A077Z9K5_TRITR|nr:BING4CT and WD40 domain containing protein [Trichuris trichiura]
MDKVFIIPFFIVKYDKCLNILFSSEIVVDKGEKSYNLTQSDIVKSVDLASAAKHFELQLPKFGPYRLDFTRNGRNLLIGGRLGHVATFDWFTKELHCEVNSSNSFLYWLDISIGKMVASWATRYGPIDVLCQNPTNGIIHCGCARGVVSLWSPNLNEPLVKMFCHPCPVRALCVDATGRFMATAGVEKRIKVWDLRNYKELWSLKAVPVSHMTFSQQGILACAMGTVVKAYKNICHKPVNAPYMIHDCREVVSDIRFCPYEDVLGVGHRVGYSSLLIPGAGEPNIDAFEANPFQSKNQRREAEVRSLLDKIQPEMITLDPADITRINEEKKNEALGNKIKFLVIHLLLFVMK